MKPATSPPLVGDPLLYGVALIAVVVCAAFFRYLQWLGDEGVVLHAAVRILVGEMPYRDFFEFLPPGSFAIVTVWMKLFGAGFAAARVLAVGVIAAIAALLYAAVRLAGGHRALAALLAVAWAVFSQGVWTVISHHWFTTAASMAAAVGLLLACDGAPRRGAALAAGLFAGAAAMLTTTRGLLVCVAVLLAVPRSRARSAVVVAGMALVPAVLAASLAVTGALAAAFEDVILFPAVHYAGIQWVPFGRGATVVNGASVALFPLTLVLAGLAVALEGVALWREPRFRASLALAVAGLAGAFPRPDVDHLNFAVPLACPLFALVVTRLLRRVGPGARTTASTLLVGVCLAGVGYALIEHMGVAAGPLRAIPTARGPVVRRDDLWTADFAALLARIDAAPRGDGFFFYPLSAMLPYLTGRRHVAAFDVMTPGYTTAAQFRATCVRVVDEARWVVIERMWLDPRVILNVWPAIRDPDPPERRGFEAALGRAFDQVVHTSTFFELRQRSGDASPALCELIAAGPRAP